MSSTSSSSKWSESKASHSEAQDSNSSVSVQSSKRSSSSSHIEMEDKKVHFSSESQSGSHDAESLERNPTLASATLRKSSMRLDWTKQAVLEQDLEKLGQSARELDEQIVNFSEKDIKENLKNIASLGNDEEALMKLAAELITDAEHGRRTLVRRKIPQAAHRLTINTFWDLFLWGIAIATMCLAFAEQPTRLEPYPKTLLIVELVFVSIQLVGCVIKMIGLNFHRYFKKTWNNIALIVCLAIITDCILMFFLPSGPGEPYLRWSRPLRPALLMARSRPIRRMFSTAVSTLFRVADVFLLLFIILLQYSVIGVQLFYGFYRDPSTDKVYDQNFDDIPSALLTMFITLTTENYPTIIVPAYERSAWTVIYFLTFMLIETYLLLSVLVAAVLDTFRQLNQERVVKDRVRERINLASAFQLLDANNNGTISIQEWRRLMLAKDKHADVDLIDAMFEAMDQDGNGQIDKFEFFNVTEVMGWKFREQKENTGCWCFRRGSHLKRFCHRLMESRPFIYTILVLVLAQIVIYCLFGTVPATSVPALYVADLIILVLFLLEMLIRITGLGCRGLFRDPWTLFDLVIVVSSLICTILLFILVGADRFQLDETTTNTARFLNSISSLRMLRVISTFRRTRRIATAVLKIASLMGSVAILLLCIFYFYGIIGMELFAGRAFSYRLAADRGSQNPFLNLTVLPTTVGSLLSPTTNATQSILPADVANFDTFGFTLLVLFQLLTASDWYSVMFEAMTCRSSLAGTTTVVSSSSQLDDPGCSYYSSWYFTSFYLVVVIVFMNLVIAIIIDRFTLQKEIESTKHTEAKLIALTAKEADGTTGVKKAFKAIKTIGKNWEREMVRKSVLESSLEPTESTKDRTTSDLEKLKEQYRRDRHKAQTRKEREDTRKIAGANKAKGKGKFKEEKADGGTQEVRPSPLDDDVSSVPPSSVSQSSPASSSASASNSQ